MAEAGDSIGELCHMTLKQAELPPFIEVSGQRGGHRGDLREIFPKHFGLPSSGELQHFPKVRDRNLLRWKVRLESKQKSLKTRRSYHHDLESWCLPLKLKKIYGVLCLIRLKLYWRNSLILPSKNFF